VWARVLPPADLRAAKQKKIKTRGRVLVKVGIQVIREVLIILDGVRDAVDL
jgi:hypothetical protein